MTTPAAASGTGSTGSRAFLLLYDINVSPTVQYRSAQPTSVVNPGAYPNITQRNTERLDNESFMFDFRVSKRFWAPAKTPLRWASPKRSSSSSGGSRGRRHGTLSIVQLDTSNLSRRCDAARRELPTGGKLAYARPVPKSCTPRTS